MSQETMNVFWSDLIRMLSKLNYFKFMQIGYLRWPPGVITNNSKNKKIPICKESLNKIDPTVFFFFFFLHEAISISCNLVFQDGRNLS